jgi:hypothetical protein
MMTMMVMTAVYWRLVAKTNYSLKMTKLVVLVVTFVPLPPPAIALRRLPPPLAIRRFSSGSLQMISLTLPAAQPQQGAL